MWVMDAEETRRALNGHGLDRLSGVGFGVRDPAIRTTYDWHAHDYHQLLYAISGPSQVETKDGRMLIPQGRAAWIPARTPHRSLIAGADGASLFFSPTLDAARGASVTRLEGGALLHEMVMRALDWQLGAVEASPLARSLFTTLALLCSEAGSKAPRPAPISNDPRVRRAMDYAFADLAAATQAGGADAAAVSTRTLRRLFEAEIGMSWQAWLRSARMTTAAALLEGGERVTDVAADVGYASLSGFAKSFAETMGAPPHRFRSQGRRSRLRRTPDDRCAFMSGP